MTAWASGYPVRVDRGRRCISPRFLPSPKESGSLDRDLLNSRLPNKHSRTSAYADLQKLVYEAARLKDETVDLQRELSFYIEPSDAPVCAFERQLQSLESRWSQREFEVTEIGRHMWSSPQPRPTFLEVDIHRNRAPAFDLVATSLLVSNAQRTFFTAQEVAAQNRELRELIKWQTEQLRCMQARIKLHSHIQHKEFEQQTIRSLKEGEFPLRLIDACPTREEEQIVKQKFLSRELKRLIARRLELTEMRRTERLMAKVVRLRESSAIKIQSVVRGFLVRRSSPPLTKRDVVTVSEASIEDGLPKELEIEGPRVPDEAGEGKIDPKAPDAVAVQEMPGEAGEGKVEPKAPEAVVVQEVPGEAGEGKAPEAVPVEEVSDKTGDEQVEQKKATEETSVSEVKADEAGEVKGETEKTTEEIALEAIVPADATAPEVLVDIADAGSD
jgi:hypothetical protein